jgi:hypothetical protein
MNYGILKRLLAIVEDRSRGRSVCRVNAERLRAIAWTLLMLQFLSAVIGAIGELVSSPDHPVDIDAGFSINGWLAVLLISSCARVFAAGTRMRDDLEGTV